ncbi:related to polyketide synthase [Phialocephala subalpina]|uniref:Related to polyketide synthase n=1 Tax=Phialocephala subalpina TaxID=576137 RepID=A0A1L7WLR3_9HELO|nr:related to polyketide synthase [Phialocephala subalpina]
MTLSKIAIVGMSGRFPGCDSLDEFWKLLQEGKDMHQEIPSTRFDVNDFYDSSGKSKNAVLTRFGCFLENPGLFDNQFFNISPREALQMDPLQRMFLAATYEALEMAGYSPDSSKLDRSRISTYFGQSTEDWRTINEQQGIQAHYLPSTNRSFAPGRINHYFKWGGGHYSIDTSCSSSATAIHLACASLLAREVDMSVVGGGNICVIPEYFSGFSLGGFLSPTGACKTFSETADGYCRGEAVGTLVLKRLEDAITGNDNILGVIAGTARNSNAGESSITYPGETSQAKLFRDLLRRSGVDANDIGYVEMHGTGTQAGDMVEISSIREVFAQSRTQPLYVGALKASVGHSEAAAGISSLIKALLMLQNDKIPPQPGPIVLNSKFDLEAANIRISDGKAKSIPRPKADGKRNIVINSFDAAGGNTSILLQDGPTKAKKQIDWLLHHVVTCSGKTNEALLSNRKRLREYLEGHDVSLPDLAYTTTARRIHHPYRESYVVESTEQLVAQLQKSSIPKQPSSTPTSLVFVFTGQSSQYTAMGTTLYRYSHRFQSILDSYESICISQGLKSFLAVIQGRIDIALATAVEVQLAIVALEIALAHFWQGLGLKPTAVLGHSLGEYSALCVAGVLSIGDTLHLVHERATLMEKYCTAGSHGMLTVPLAATSTKELLRDASSSWELCCANAPQSMTIGGPLDELEPLQAGLDRKGLKSTRLEVQYAFHSQQMSVILEEFEQVTSRVHFGHPEIPVASSLTGAVVDAAGVFDATHLVRQVREPVNFIGALKSLEAEQLISNSSFVIEIGPHPVCIGLIRSCLPHVRITALPSLQRSHSDWEIVSKCLAAAHNHHIKVDWEAFHNDRLDRLTLLTLPSYAFEMKDYWASYQRQPTLLPARERYVDQQEPRLPGKCRVERSVGRLKTLPDFALSSTCIQRLKSISDDGLSAVFISHTSESYLFKAIQGHLVDGIAICPASILIDIAYTAAKTLLGYGTFGAKGQNFEVIDLNMTKSLVVSGEDPEQTIRAHATVDPSRDFVTLQISSGSSDISSEHATCRVLVHKDGNPKTSEWHRVQRLVKMRVDSLCDPARSDSCHKMATELMYKLFDSIVEYDSPFRILDNICVAKDFQDAVAELRMLPPTSRGTFTHDIFCVDTLVHLPGFLLNSSLTKPKDDLHIASSIGRVVILEDLSENRPLTCYATTRQTGEGTTFCDVYLFRDAHLVALVTDICFRKISRKIFSAMTNNDLAPTRRQTRGLQTAPSQTKLPSLDQAQALEFSQRSLESQSLFSLLLEVIASETGVELNEIRPESCFADLGVDSHMSMAITAEFNERTGMQLPAAFFHNYPRVADAENELKGEELSSTPTLDVSVHDNQTPSTSVSNQQTNNSHQASEITSPLPISQGKFKHKARAILLQGRSNSSTTPLFLVAESSGSVSVYTHFPPLPHGRRIFGLESPFSNCPQDHNMTVPELAKAYIETLRDTQPTGPYLLGGFSFASVYAYEIAYQLALSGERLLGLLIIDMYVPPPAQIGTSRFSLDGIGEGPLANVTTRISGLFPKFTDNQKVHMGASMRLAESYTPIPIPNGLFPQQTHLFWATKGVNENDHPEEHDDSLVGPAWMGVSEKPWEEMTTVEMATLLKSWFFSTREAFGNNGWEKLAGNNIHIHKVDAGELVQTKLQKRV